MPALKRKGSQKTSSKKKQVLDDSAFDWSANGDNDELIDSGSEQEDAEEEYESEEEAKETAGEKRVRLAKEYLERLRSEQDSDEEDDTTDKVGEKLEEDSLEASGKIFKQIASCLDDFEFDDSSRKILRGHKLSVTSVAISPDDQTIFSASKDGAIMKWDIQTGKRTAFKFPKDDPVHDMKDRKRAIYSITVSPNGQFLVSGGADRLVRVWDLHTEQLIESFSGHRDTISSVKFRENSLSLFTGSFDRTIKHWNLNEMGYVETLFGHQQDIIDIHAMRQERVISVGRDRSARVWKIPEETQLIFNATQGSGMSSYGSSLDCVRMLPQNHFITGSDDGAISLWSHARKKPLHTKSNIHGSVNNWISSLGHLKNTDLVASGSNNGQLCLWKTDLQNRTFESVATVPVDGYINSIEFSTNGRFIVAGLGQEHRLGRWSKCKKAKNGIALIALPDLSEQEDEDSDDDSENENVDENSENNNTDVSSDEDV